MARRPPGRPRGASLGFDDVVDAAIALVAAGGLGGVTVGALADRLGVGRTTVYHHAGTLEVVRDAVCDRVVARFPEPVADPADWRRWFEEMLAGARATMLDFEGVSRRIRTAGPRTRHQLALVERATGVLLAAGFGARAAALGFSALMAVTCDTVEFAELRRAEGTTGAPARTDWQQLLASGDAAPALAEVLPVFLGVTNEETFAFTTRALLDGLDRQLAMEGNPNSSI